MLPPLYSNPINITIFGAGAFGTAMAVVAARNGHRVTLLCSGQTQADAINTKNLNPNIFQETILSPTIKATTDHQESLLNSELIIHAIPVQSSYSFLKKISQYIPKNIPVLSTSKGIHADTEMLMCDVFESVLGKNHPLAFLSGPSFAKDLILGSPSAVVIGSLDENVALYISSILSSRLFKVFVTDDVIGVELGGALKNPLAIGAGVIQGLGYGANTVASFIVRGAVEMTKLAVRMGAKKETLSGLSGIGDLVLTTYGGLSRNQMVGLRLGKGEKLNDILQSMNQVAEGVATSGVVVKLAQRYNLRLPIFNVIHDFIQGNITSEEGLSILMDTPIKREHND